MDTQGHRELQLKALNFLMNEDATSISLMKIDCKTFVRIHQSNFKDHYLSKPPIALEAGDFSFLYEIIKEKYNEYFLELGIEKAHQWLNPSLYSDMSLELRREDFTRKMIMYEIGEHLELTNEECELTSELFNDLYTEAFSSYSITWFILELMDEIEWQ
jgi:hypothetical protein